MKNIRKRLKYIFPVLILIMVVGLILSRVYQPNSTPAESEVKISAVKASEYVGTVAEVCGEVASTDYLPQIGGQPTFINLGRPHPDQLFTAVIWGNNRTQWREPPEKFYADQVVCVSGEIEMHEGTPQIIIERQDQIEIQ